jgi:hypothetical protein
MPKHCRNTVATLSQHTLCQKRLHYLAKLSQHSSGSVTNLCQLCCKPVIKMLQHCRKHIVATQSQYCLSTVASLSQNIIATHGGGKTVTLSKICYTTVSILSQLYYTTALHCRNTVTILSQHCLLHYCRSTVTPQSHY